MTSAGPSAASQETLVAGEDPAKGKRETNVNIRLRLSPDSDQGHPPVLALAWLLQVSDPQRISTDCFITLLFRSSS